MDTFYSNELLKYLDFYDLDEEEFLLLEEWISHGNSTYRNPDGFCDLDGAEMDFIRWHWIMQDDTHPEHSRLMNHTIGMTVSIDDEELPF